MMKSPRKQNPEAVASEERPTWEDAWQKKLNMRLTPRPHQPVSLMPTPTYNKIITSTSCKPHTRSDLFIPRAPNITVDVQWAMGIYFDEQTT